MAAANHVLVIMLAASVQVGRFPPLASALAVAAPRASASAGVSSVLGSSGGLMTSHSSPMKTSLEGESCSSVLDSGFLESSSNVSSIGRNASSRPPMPWSRPPNAVDRASNANDA
nr:uncharacterized protein LOC113818860 [Penaeus vannamei]